MGEGRPKTNEYCPEYVKGGKCKKIKKPCNNRSNFYVECNTFKGNRSLNAFS